MDNEQLLDELIHAYNLMLEYIYRSDSIKWSPEAEKKAIENYNNFRYIVLERMES